MSKLSISTAWDETRAILVRDGRLLVAVALALVVLPTVIVGLIVPSDPADGDASHAVIQIVGALIVLIGQLALIRLAIGPATSVGAAISHGARRFPAMLGSIVLLLLLFAALLLPLLIILGAAGAVDLKDPARATGATAGVVLLMLIAVLALSVRFMLSAPIAAAESVGPLAILKRSWSLSSGHYWRLLALLILLLIVAVILLMTATVIGGIVGAVISPDLDPLTLGALVVAEGIETEAEFAALRAIGIRYVQGYLFARPEIESLPEASLALVSKVRAA